MKNNRRVRLDLMYPAERAIFVAMQEIEKLEADKRLTKAVILLANAKDSVADYFDERDMQEDEMKNY